jgi:hypothetical protein
MYSKHLIHKGYPLGNSIFQMTIFVFIKCISKSICLNRVIKKLYLCIHVVVLLYCALNLNSYLNLKFEFKNSNRKIETENRKKEKLHLPIRPQSLSPAQATPFLGRMGQINPRRPSTSPHHFISVREWRTGLVRQSPYQHHARAKSLLKQLLHGAHSQPLHLMCMLRRCVWGPHSCHTQI